MSEENVLNKNVDNNELQVEHDLQMEKLREEVLKKFFEYNKIIQFMAADAPISTLCLPPTIEKKLTSNGLLRVYDLINFDLTKIEGLGEVSIRNLTSRLNQFFSML